MSAPDTTRCGPAWLALREPADADARAVDLLDPLRRWLAAPAGAGERGAGPPRLMVRDLGCGTGSMGRWLAGRLAGPQHWILHDRDAEILDHAAAHPAPAAADGAQVTVETGVRDVTRLSAADLAGTSLVTASALLDMLTADEVDRLVSACAGAGVPALLTLSVVGRVELAPADPLDAEIIAAFNEHQRRRVDGRQLLGPNAVEAAAAAFARHGIPTLVRPAPWRLGPDHPGLLEEWLCGWVAAAREQRPALAPGTDRYIHRRLAAAAAGELRVVVHHSDLLALPAPAGRVMS